jgi:6-phosphofructokinase 1
MLTSGGDCQALNAAMRGVVKGVCTKRDDVEIYGFEDGYKGLIYGNFHMLTSKDFSGILTRGGTILGTSRQPFKLMRVPDKDGLDKVAAMKHTYHKLSLDCLVILGGNGTHKTANLLREEGLNVVTLPKTIDNDLIHTDHTPGFGSAAKYIASSMLEIAHDTFIYAVKSVTIVEIMGRDAGWLTAASALARNEYNTAPQFIYLPEVDFDKDKFVADIKEALEHTNNVIVAVSEGIHDADGSYITSSKAACDQFGHQQLSGAGKALEFIVKENIGVKVRSVEVNVLQRCASHLASLTDIEESFAQGKKGVMIAAEGVTASMVCLKRISNDPYQVEYTYSAIKDIANEAKSVPREWINDAGNDVKPELIEYLKPLIQGETAVAYKNGLPDYMDVSHLHKCN